MDNSSDSDFESSEENKEKEYKSKMINKESVFYINKNIYKAYDSQQNEESDMEIEEPIDKEISEKMFKQFKDYISKIDVTSDNNISNKNITSNISEKTKYLLEKQEINQIINHNFGDNLRMENFVDAFGKAIESNINKNWKKKTKIKIQNFIRKNM